MSSEASTHLIPIWNAAAFREPPGSVLRLSSPGAAAPHWPTSCLPHRPHRDCSTTEVSGPCPHSTDFFPGNQLSIPTGFLPQSSFCPISEIEQRALGQVRTFGWHDSGKLGCLGLCPDLFYEFWQIACPVRASVSLLLKWQVGLELWLANFFYKRSNRKYFRLMGHTIGVCLNYPPLPCSVKVAINDM